MSTNNFEITNTKHTQRLRQYRNKINNSDWGNTTVANLNQVHAFSVKWINKFVDSRINYMELVDFCMADDCVRLGFEMDDGRAFKSVYGKAVSDSNELSRIKDSITDINLLGSAIYSRWRYFIQRECDGVKILKPKNREWFIIALGRLGSLSGKNPLDFEGVAKKIRIVSNNCGYGIACGSDEEVEQHLTINNEGRVWFSTYAFVGRGMRYKKIRSKNFSIDKYSAMEILNKVFSYFSEEYEEVFATDIGEWVLEITNTDGKVYSNLNNVI